MLEVTRVEADTRCVFFNDLDGAERSLSYDYLILATGV
jgi:NADH dehydrogenase FAD-containing subunit